MPDLTLTGDLIRLRPVQPTDTGRFAAILAEPSVARWWTLAPGGAVADWLADGDQVTFAIEREGAVIGSVQFSEVDEPDYRRAGIDLFVATAAQGKGYGTDAVRTVARYLFQVRHHHRLTIDPAAANERAIHVYRKVGFRPVGIMRSYERGSDGTWHDGLLMDLLADELT
ncbi:MAG TPA: GNAT family protein [Candidatus Baltobacteraceae bacterium]|nr:GNAT family protein [Candidatus Baltobacteraceae bacterium]